MNEINILILGAGAAGLMAARELAQAGKKVTVLEARDRCGGRIHTLNNGLFFKNAELGAEFIHGDLQLTLNLLDEAGIARQAAGGEMWHSHDGKLDNEGPFAEGWDALMEKLAALTIDTTINQFLEKEFFDEKYEPLKKSVRRFAAGYDNADPDKASAFALRDEWMDDDHNQYRVKGGYRQMIAFLEDEVKKAGGQALLNSIAKRIEWKENCVKVVTDDGASYEAEKVIVALPLGVLQADQAEKAAISFSPPIPEYVDALGDIGFGAVIKILLEFDAPFWEDKQTAALAGISLKNMGFVLSDEEIPAWWTQVPIHSPVLTGWFGGPAAEEKKGLTDEEILQLSIVSLSNIFRRSIDELKDRLLSFHTTNWTAEPFSLGSYAYDMVGSTDARKVLCEPIENTLFFAGEYLYGGPAMGTVEAALISGKEVAARILG
ncbi:MAG TPA: NAD(P)/FAD-dependent oxidoreductase [Mucilaginibacter sp.]|jgi:monoamine oxidase|nr:NAD(P)/FAD-dependent oxidoreductase [Mucilaginibacter sp.]